MVAAFLISLIAAGAGLAGVLLGGWLGDRREREKRRNDFITRQLSEFYGPLVSLRAEILARAELRVKIKARISEKLSGTTPIERVTEASQKSYMAILVDEGNIFKDITMPLYRKMLDVFRERMWLAEPQTRGHLAALVEFVDVWERHLRNTIPDEIVWEIEHSEENLKPFYRHVEETHDQLRQELVRVEPWLSLRRPAAGA